MKAKILLSMVAMAMMLPTALFARQKQGPTLPVRVANVTLTDLDKHPAQFADYGKRHLMIFYVDPDAHRQNRQFQADIEADADLQSPNIQAYAVLNLKDTALPNGIVRSMADKRTAGKPSINLADPGHILRDAWALGDCNGKFCLLFVTREGRLVYFRAGEFTEQDKADFYATVDRYK
jgi:hypothetical protein